MNEIVQLAVADLKKRYKSHTIILYGSYARGEATETSDIDIACFGDDVEEIKDARLFQGIYLDAWLYPTSSLDSVSESDHRFGDGIAVVDERGLGKKHISQVQKKLLAGTEKMKEADLLHLKEWIEKMLTRASIDDLDGNYRRIWLQFELLSLYFEIRGLWFLGHKKSFSYLCEHDSEAYVLFKTMYSSPKSNTCLRKLANHVTRI
jgi:hypothetical protein